MPFPNDSSRIARGVANLEVATNDYTTSPNVASRSLIRKNAHFLKPAVDGAASTATAYTAFPLQRMKNPGRVMGAFITATAAVTGDPTNNAVINIVTGDGLGGAQVVVATVTTTANLVAGVPFPIPLSATLANLKFAAGQVLGVSITKGGTGVVIPVSTFDVDYEEEGPDGYQV